MMVFAIESVVLCLVFTLMVYIMSRKPIQTLYNYPPKIQERVKSLDEYKEQIPTEKNKIVAKIGACILFVIVISLILRFVNGYTTFLQAFGWGFLLWTIVNLYDAIVLDIIFDGDYGCEELQPGQKPKVSVTLVYNAGNEKFVTVEDDWLTENDLDVGSEWPAGV